MYAKDFNKIKNLSILKKKTYFISDFEENDMLESPGYYFSLYLVRTTFDT